MKTIRFFDGDLGSEEMMVRCNLSDASAPVEVDYCTGEGWQATQYQCADARHTESGLVEIGETLAAAAVEMPADDFACESEAVEDRPKFRINRMAGVVVETLDSNGVWVAATGEDFADRDAAQAYIDDWCDAQTGVEQLADVEW